MRATFEFDNTNFIWKVKDDLSITTPEREEILKLLETENKEMRTGEIAELLGKSGSTVSMLLKKMLQEGLIENPRTGYYRVKRVDNSDSCES